MTKEIAETVGAVMGWVNESRDLCGSDVRRILVRLKRALSALESMDRQRASITA